MQTFQSFVLTIKKHTEGYTLDMLKKNQKSEGESTSNYEGKSILQKKMILNTKRKMWKTN